MRKPGDYVAIREWGHMMGSFPYYIENEQRDAAADDAPIDAIYKNAERWVTVDDLAPDNRFRALYAAALAK